MPKRGSVQFLLLSFRPRATLGWGLGAAAVILLVAGLIQTRVGFPLLDKDGLAHAVRQSVWKQALAGQSKPERWPWDDMSVNMSLVPVASVPRLGLSAAIVKHAAPEPAASIPHRTARLRQSKDTALLGDVALSDVTIGDSITFTANDGAVCVYRVSGRRVVDPHLADSQAERIDAATSLFTCEPLGRLIIGAAHSAHPHQGARARGALNGGAPQATPPALHEQRNL